MRGEIMKNRNWFWGIVFLLLAVFVIASQMNAFHEIGVMTYIASILLVALIVHSSVNRNFFGFFLPMVFIYKLYQGPLALPEISLWLLLLAALFAGIGISIIFKVHPKKLIINSHGKKFSNTKESLDDNNPYAKVSFGSSSKYLHGNCIKNGQFIASFGALEIYFDQAQLNPEGAELFLDCSFGEIKLYIPKSWNVTDNLQVSLGGVENKNKFVKPDENAPHLNLTGNVQFGAVEIEYI
jgi:predicted membrane protein